MTAQIDDCQWAITQPLPKTEMKAHHSFIMVAFPQPNSPSPGMVFKGVESVYMVV
jgi:hypothetical protein